MPTICPSIGKIRHFVFGSMRELPLNKVPSICIDPPLTPFTLSLSHLSPTLPTPTPSTCRRQVPQRVVQNSPTCRSKFANVSFKVCQASPTCCPTTPSFSLSLLLPSPVSVHQKLSWYFCLFPSDVSSATSTCLFRLVPRAILALPTNSHPLLSKSASLLPAVSLICLLGLHLFLTSNCVAIVPQAPQTRLLLLSIQGLALAAGLSHPSSCSLL